MEITTEPLPRLLAEVDLALVCSGTASLEAALAGVPHELVYRTGAFNGSWGRRLVHTSHIGLSNIILEQTMVREHIQDQASPLPLARSLLRWLARPAERAGILRGRPPASRDVRPAGSVGPDRRRRSWTLPRRHGSERRRREGSEMSLQA